MLAYIKTDVERAKLVTVMERDYPLICANFRETKGKIATIAA